MKKQLFAAAGAAAALLLAAMPAAADIVMVDASSIQGANVLFNDGEQIDTTVEGATQGGTVVAFTGTSGGGTTIRANGGQARIEGIYDDATNNPNDTLTLDSLFFNLANGNTFNNLEFNLLGGDASTAFFTLVDDGGTSFNFQTALGNGENFVGFQGILGQSIASVSITFDSGGVGDVRQVRLDEVTGGGGPGTGGPIPEPGTWALMITGFGGAGAMLRRRRTAVAA